jgi:hypothetical protein
MHFAMNSIMSPRAALAGLLMLAACPTAYAQSAYITQVDSHASGAIFPLASQPTQTVPVNQYTPSQTAFVPMSTPEMTVPHNANGNFAQTLEIGKNNSVFQGQAGGNNISNVTSIGSNSKVGVLQGGHDFSNIVLINMQGPVWVLQPPNAPPLNELMAKLPNGKIVVVKAK